MAAPTLPTRQLITHKPTKGFDTSSIPHRPFDPDQLVMTNVAQNPLVHLPTITPMSVVDRGPEPPSSHLMDVDSATPFVLSSTPTAAPDAIIRTLVSHHMHADVARVQPAPKPVKKRKRRTCAKCAHPECSGSQKSLNCRSPCQDCKKTTCRGHNSSRPKKPCNTPGLWDK
ncbi:hypothetical protein BYT27DRAFT_7342186 [Phlegmacium glaucopus]|nr:hypothetical protein BYT27DRAFT_7342186 [Phlegmacium glaucopus]